MSPTTWIEGEVAPSGELGYVMAIISVIPIGVVWAEGVTPGAAFVGCETPEGSFAKCSTPSATWVENES